MRTVRRRLELALSAFANARRLHQLSHALLARPNATRRKLAPDTRPAISSLHFVENRLDVNQKGHVTDPATGMEWTGFSHLARPILAIAAGADIQHPALRRHRPDRSMSLAKGVSHRTPLANYTPP